jgi:valyl-tRNA synthetase
MGVATGIQDVGQQPATRDELHQLYRLIRQQNQNRPGRDTIVQYPIATQAAVGKQKDIGGMKVIQKVKVEQQAKAKSTKKKTGITKKKTGITKKKTGITTLKKEYSTLRKQLIALFKKTKRDTYKARNEVLKKNPAKGRSAERKAIKDALKTKLQTLLKMLPSAAKLKKSAILHLFSRAKTLKW